MIRLVVWAHLTRNYSTVKELLYMSVSGYLEDRESFEKRLIKKTSTWMLLQIGIKNDGSMARTFHMKFCQWEGSCWGTQEKYNQNYLWSLWYANNLLFRFFLDCVQSQKKYPVDDRGAQEESGGARIEPEFWVGYISPVCSVTLVTQSLILCTLIWQ